MNPTLAVLGAGAKAVAVAAKASVLCDMWGSTPDVIAVERIGVGGQLAGQRWLDRRSFHRLGTSPEKGCRFSYRSALVPRRNAELTSDDPLQLAVVSDRHRVVRGMDRDRGRPAPTHRRWSQYLACGRSHWPRQIHGEVERLAVTATAGRCAPTRPLQADVDDRRPARLKSRYRPKPARARLHSSGTVPPATTDQRRAGRGDRWRRDGFTDAQRAVPASGLNHHRHLPQVTLFTRGEGFFRRTHC